MVFSHTHDGLLPQLCPLDVSLLKEFVGNQLRDLLLNYPGFGDSRHITGCHHHGPASLPFRQRFVRRCADHINSIEKGIRVFKRGQKQFSSDVGDKELNSLCTKHFPENTVRPLHFSV